MILMGKALMTMISQTFKNEYTEKEHQKVKQLKIKTRILNKKKGSNMELSFPESRLNRDHSKLEVETSLNGYLGRVQSEYNDHPVGQYMGPYDQNRNLELKVQLPNSDLDFSNYTEFQHDGDR